MSKSQEGFDYNVKRTSNGISMKDMNKGNFKPLDLSVPERKAKLIRKKGGKDPFIGSSRG